MWSFLCRGAALWGSHLRDLLSPAKPWTCISFHRKYLHYHSFSTQSDSSQSRQSGAWRQCSRTFTNAQEAPQQSPAISSTLQDKDLVLKKGSSAETQSQSVYGCSCLHCLSSPTKRKMSLYTGQKVSIWSILPLLSHWRRISHPTASLWGKFKTSGQDPPSLLNKFPPAMRHSHPVQLTPAVQPRPGVLELGVGPHLTGKHAHDKLRVCWSPTLQAVLRWPRHACYLLPLMHMQFFHVIWHRPGLQNLLSHKCQCQWFWLNRDRDNQQRICIM